MASSSARNHPLNRCEQSRRTWHGQVVGRESNRFLARCGLQPLFIARGCSGAGMVSYSFAQLRRRSATLCISKWRAISSKISSGIEERVGVCCGVMNTDNSGVAVAIGVMLSTLSQNSSPFPFSSSSSTSSPLYQVIELGGDGQSIFCRDSSSSSSSMLEPPLGLQSRSEEYAVELMLEAESLRSRCKSASSGCSSHSSNCSSDISLGAVRGRLKVR
jgi:hypothetical protein